MEKQWKRIVEKNGAGAILLYFLSFLYRIAYTGKFIVFETGILKKVRLRSFVVSVGNITVGGTGKTPFVCYIAEILKKKNLKPAVLSRGYGGSKKGIVSDGKKMYMTVHESSDESFMTAQKTSVPVITGKHRRFSGRMAENNFGCRSLVLDDGYQYFRMYRDVNILLINARNPFGNFKLLPAGILREPLEQMKRADIIVLTKCDQKNTYSELVMLIKKYCPHTPLFTSWYEIDSMIYTDGRKFLPEDCAGKKTAFISSIAEPEYFEYMLWSQRLPITEYTPVRLNDHQAYSESFFEKLVQETGCDFFFTTEKDAVKLRNLKLNVPVVSVETRLVIQDRERFENELFNSYYHR